MEAKGKPAADLVRTSVLVRSDTDEALRRLAEMGKRPLSYEIRSALEEYVERQREQLDGAAA